MSEKSLLGIEWLDFYKRWVINIVNNINPDFDGFNFGFSIELPVRLNVEDNYGEWNSNNVTEEYFDT